MDTIIKANKVKVLLDSPEWNNILIPLLNELRDDWRTELESSKDTISIFRLQGKLEGINEFMMRLNFIIFEGEEEQKRHGLDASKA